MGLFGGSENKTTSTTTPWGPQGEGLKYGFSKARKIYDAQRKTPFYGFSDAGTQGLESIKNTASGTNPFLAPAQNAVTGVASGENQIGTGGMFGDIYGQSQGPGGLSQGMYGDVASGGMVGDNPFLAAARDDAMQQTRNQINASMSSAGRLGSGFYGEGMARGLGGVAADFNLQSYNADMDRMMAAAQGRSAEDLARMGVGLSAAQGQTGVEGQNISNMLGAAGMSPAMDAMRYSDAERLAGVGGAEDERAAAERNYQWDMLNKYQNIFGGVPGSAGSTTEPGSSPWLTALGGASTGAGIGSKILPGYGTMFGAAAGGLAGLFSGM